ncbi:MAG: hypothetical protein J6R82_00700 [Clostridia bacterium]|nr:hypothetical protein [Clostridia bacterium]
MLVLKRESAKWADVARGYKVIIDGVQVGEIRDGETKEYPLTDGYHTLKLKIDWCSSQEEAFAVKNGEEVFATCAPAKKPFLFGELIYITFLYNRYIDLKIEE